MSFGIQAGYDPTIVTIKTDVPGLTIDRALLAHFQVAATDAVAASVNGVHTAVTDNGAQQVITTGITNPNVPRNITATAGGTAGDIKAIRVTVEGTNYAGEAISEQLPAFTVDTAGSVSGAKAFATVTKITIPAHDGTGATTAIGWGNALGLPYKLPHNTIYRAYLNNVKESTDPTITTSTTAIDGNTMTLNSSLNGSVVDAYLSV